MEMTSLLRINLFEGNGHNDCLVETRVIENLAFHEPDSRDYPCSAILSTCPTIAAEATAVLCCQNTLEITLDPPDPEA